jgi:hypothetical protein
MTSLAGALVADEVDPMSNDDFRAKREAWKYASAIYRSSRTMSRQSADSLK